MKLSILIPVYNQEELVIKALDNLPRRDDIEVLVRDDGSADSTLTNLYRYAEDTDLNLRIRSNGENKGVAYTKNRLREEATGEYFHIHDSDDFVTPDYSKVIDRLYETDADIVCFDLIVNDGGVFQLKPETQDLYCAQIARFIRSDFAKDITFPESVRAGDDWFFARDLMQKNPKIIYTGVQAYRYNFPREGSLCDLRKKGIYP